MVSPVTKGFEMELGVKSKYSILIFSPQGSKKERKEAKAAKGEV